MRITVGAPPYSPLGAGIPSATPHAVRFLNPVSVAVRTSLNCWNGCNQVSVSLPTWADNVDYEEGAERIVKAMKSGYPRFFIHHQIDQVRSAPSTYLKADYQDVVQ